MTAENETVNVFNNSTVPNLAADVSGTLKDQGTRIGEVGNITEEQAILQENTVFFDPATPGAEERARVLAERVGGVAKPNDATVPENAAKPGSLTLVLTGPVGL
nr:LytR C-terminal domain-containing protein [Corynebacterium meitnerae]